jgi:ketosteroid isomerase-like protein
MSQENVERLRPVYREWGRGNFKAGTDLLDEDVVFVTFIPGEADEVTYRGLAGVADFMREFLTQWKDFTWTAEDFVANADKVFVVGQQRARGRQSGATVEMTAFTVWTFRAGKAVHLQFFRDRRKALEAAGLSD